MWKVLLILLLLGAALEYAGARKPPKKPAKVKGCIGENGKLYKKGESVQEECYTKTCLYRRRKWFWKSRLTKNECCAFTDPYLIYAPFGTYYVPNGWKEWTAGKFYVCTNGKLEIVKLGVSPALNVTRQPNKTSTFNKLLKRERVCTKISSLHKSIPGLTQLIGSQYEEHLRREISKIIKNYEGEQDYVCGLQNTVNLFEETELKRIVVQRVNEIFEENGHSGIVSAESNDFRNDSREERVIGGAPANLGQFPWQARLEVTTCDGSFLCGGVLISPCYVLTARHCAAEWETNPQNDFTVILGDINRVGTQPGEQQFGVHFVHLHPNIKYDIALLLLKQSPTQSDLIAPVRLTNTYPGIGERARVSGWGRFTSFSGSSVGLLWREIDLPTFWWCHQYIENNIGNYCKSLEYDELCGGDLTTPTYAGSCHGDSGGPLVRRNPNDNQWELIGVVARGVPNCPAGFDHTIYTSVIYGPIRWWIDSILEKSTNPGFGGNCRCNARGTKFINNALQTAWWDTANCYLEHAPPGCGSGGFASKSGRQFVWYNMFYIKPHKAINCPMGGFDTCHCNLGAVPAGGSVGGVCPNPSWGTGSFFLPGTINAPLETCAFEWSGNRYTTPQGTGSPAHCPKGFFEGSNCHYYRAVPVDTNAFLWPGNPAADRGYYYGYPAQTYNCPKPVCFPATSEVMLADGSTKKMENVLIGDHLLAISSTGKQTFSKFIGWLHNDKIVHQLFLEIFTAKGSIKLSSHHLIMRKTIEMGINNKQDFSFAQDVSPGDFVYIVNKNTSNFNWQKVTAIKPWFGRGIFAPLTEEGTVVVDGMVASCYAEVQEHTLAHAAMYPVRVFPFLLDTQESQHRSGLRTFPEKLVQLAKMFGLVRNDLQVKKEERAGIASAGDVLIYAAFVVFSYNR